MLIIGTKLETFKKKLEKRKNYLNVGTMKVLQNWQMYI